MAPRPEISVIRGNGYSIVDVSMLKSLIRDLPEHSAFLVERMGVDYKRYMQEAFDTDGWGTWPSKGYKEPGVPPKVMRGRTGAASLRGFQRGRPMRSYSDVEMLVGWSTKPHPDAGVLGNRRQTPRPTIAEVMIAQEFGVAQGRNVRGRSGSTPVGWGRYGSLFNIPARRWLTLVADKKGDDILLRRVPDVKRFLADYQRLPVPRDGKQLALRYVRPMSPGR